MAERLTWPQGRQPHLAKDTGAVFQTAYLKSRGLQPFTNHRLQGLTAEFGLRSPETWSNSPRQELCSAPSNDTKQTLLCLENKLISGRNTGPYTPGGP